MAGSVIGALRVNLGLDKARFSQGLKQSEGEVAAFRGRILKMAAGLTGVFAGVMTIRGAGTAADEWSDLSSQVGNTIGNMQGAPAVMRQLSDMARQSYSDLSQTVGAFNANSTALKDLGYATQQQLDYTEALNNALVISNARGQKAASVQDALSKAMATGKLSGDGLNTILASGGRVAQALADELGTTQSGLRKLGSEGKITGDIIASAMLNSMEALREEAGNMPATITDGMTLIRNAALEAVGTFDSLLGVSGGIGTALVAVADAIRTAVRVMADNADTVILVLNTLLASAGVVAAFFAGRYALAVGVTAVRAMIAAAQSSIALEMALGAQTRAAAVAGVATKALTGAMTLLRGALISTGIGALVVAAGFLIAKFMELVRKAGGFGNALSLVGDIGGEVWRRLGQGAALMRDMMDGAASFIAGVFTEAFATIVRGFAKMMTMIARGLKIVGVGDGVGIGSEYAEELTKEAANKVDFGKTVMADAAESLRDLVTAPLESLAHLNDTVDAIEDVDDAATPAAASLADLGDAADKAGGGAKKATDKMTELQRVLKGLREEATELQETMGMSDVDAAVWKNLRDAGVSAGSVQGQEIDELTRQIHGMETLKSATEDWRTTLRGTFAELTQKGASFRDMLATIVDKFGEMFATRGFDALWSGGLGDGVSGFLSRMGGGIPAIGQNANGTPSWSGGWTSVHERGGEILDLPNGTRIIPHDVSKQMMNGAGGTGQLQVSLSPELVGTVLKKAAGQSIELMQQGFDKYTREVLPQAVGGVMSDPRAIG